MKCPKSEDFLEFTPRLYAMNGILQGNTHSVEQSLTSPNCLAVAVDYGLRTYAFFLRTYNPLIEICP